MVKRDFIEGKDFYYENGLVILTHEYHMQRGSCCGNGCRHCCYCPRHIKGEIQINHNCDTQIDLDILDKLPIG